MKFIKKNKNKPLGTFYLFGKFMLCIKNQILYDGIKI